MPLENKKRRLPYFEILDSLCVCGVVLGAQIPASIFQSYRTENHSENPLQKHTTTVSCNPGKPDRESFCLKSLIFDNNI